MYRQPIAQVREDSGLTLNVILLLFHLSLCYLCFLVASLMKAVKYCGNPDSEKPISFESVSAALSNIYSNKVSHASWPAGVIRQIRMQNQRLCIFWYQLITPLVFKTYYNFPLPRALCYGKGMFPFLTWISYEHCLIIWVF